MIVFDLMDSSIYSHTIIKHNEQTADPDMDHYRIPVAFLVRWRGPGGMVRQVIRSFCAQY
jgi:hypothetical protein